MAEEAPSLKTRSRVSCSVRSSTSSTESAAAKARAKAEAAKARLAFAEREVSLKLEKAKLEASLTMLNYEKETAAAIAEAEALEAVVDATGENHSCKLSVDATPLNTAERTEQYVFDQNRVEETEAQTHADGELVKEELSGSFSFSHLKPDAPSFFPDRTTSQSLHFAPQQHYISEDNEKPKKIRVKNESMFNPHYSRPQNDNPNPLHPTSASNNSGSNLTDFVRFLARRELVATSLLQFNDKPQNYRAWKRSFKMATSDLNLLPSEEMDLLLKWLGKESAQHVEQIRAIHISRPEAGLAMIWARLDVTYGSAEAIEDALFKRLDAFPKITNRDFSKLTTLGDLLMEVQSAKSEGYLPGLSFLDTTRGVNPIVHKLPFRLQERWASVGGSYKRKNGVPYPPFSYFVDFVCQEAKTANDPSFNFISHTDMTPQLVRTVLKSNKFKEVSVHKTEVSPRVSSGTIETSLKTDDCNEICLIHRKPHPLHKCRAFREKTIQDRMTFLRENNVCFRCCSSSSHIARNCKTKVQCAECKSEKHHTALHPEPSPQGREADPSTEHGGEDDNPAAQPLVNIKCTEICGGELMDRSCSKICLVKVYPAGCKDKSVKLYAILDEQSNRSLVRSQFFEVFNDQSPIAPYTLRTCAGVKEAAGRRASGYEVESLDGNVRILLPSLIECNDIPNNRDEIPTPNVALHHPHLKPVAHFIPEIDPHAQIMLLLGRDIIRVHKVRKQVNGSHNQPYAQKLDLGWVIVGNVCLGSTHKPSTISTFYTRATELTRPTLFDPCPNVFCIKEKYSDIHVTTYPSVSSEVESNCDADHLGCTVFKQTKEDNQVAPSIQDASFMKIMREGLHKDSNQSWVAPLPFKSPRRRLPNNRPQAMKRLMSLRHNFKRKHEMRDHFLSFMDKMFKNGHAEVAPPISEEEEKWYLPIFGVYHPRKPRQIRVVFDSSAQYEGVSLNDVLLAGPDLNNSLLGVLIRFRKEAVAFSVDIEQMFYCFLVREEDRNFLRFLWFQENDLSKDVVDYRMRVHVFGNRPSPAVAMYGLHRSVYVREPPVDPDVRDFVTRDFYVDDGLKSLPTVEAAVNLLKKTQDILSKSNLRLHKIASNNKKVMEAFPAKDHASSLKDLDLDADILPVQRSLGLNWNLQTDSFLFSVSDDVKPYTRRGVLSTVNSLYDPLGFVAPVTIQGKAILRELTMENGDWDAPLPQGMEETWMLWRASLSELSNLSISRPYTEMSSLAATRRELHVFCDASTKAIAAVAYLKVSDVTGNSCVGFVMGKAKLAPRPELTMPRLELCAAVLATELSELILKEIDLQLDATSYYSDSRVVLGYIHNETRRFYVFVHNRVTRIRRSSCPEQWHYVSTDQNPADHATRSVAAGRLKDTNWLSGPSFLSIPEQSISEDTYNMVDPSSDPDVRSLVSSLCTATFSKQLGSQRFDKFSSWKSLTRAIARLVHIACRFSAKRNENSSCKGWHCCNAEITVEELNQASTIVIQSVQKETYLEEIKCIQKQGKIPKSSPLHGLDPFIDEHGLLRVGGRLHHSGLNQVEKNPLIIPGKHHVATLLIRHHHEQVRHQGRHFTEGAIRIAGFWIIGGKRKVSNIIQHCVTCKRLRAPFSAQKMADLPAERLATDPPFTNVGLDVFGPWSVSSRRTRGGLVHSKRWAVIFTCMSVRAIHIEVIESLDTSSFINALRRFLAVRGPVKRICSDRGTNFVGASKDLRIPSNIDNPTVKTYLTDQGCAWTFNPPHASHHGGSWERMIGLARRILDSMFLQLKDKLTHEVLVTFMAEVAAIINARPLVPVINDPDDTYILTPAALLTQKVNVVLAPAGEFEVSDLYKCQWRQVQHLSNTFWDRWRKQFLPTLQPRKKWQSIQPNIKQGSVVLLKDSHAPRNVWPLGLVTKTFPGEDGKVRQVEVKIVKPGGITLFLRPITEIVLLLSSDV